MGHSTLEITRTLSGSTYTKVAVHTGDDANYNATYRELPLPSPAIHVRDICVRGPTLWAWMAILLQYWQDHICKSLYDGWVRPVSELMKVLLRDINPWLPHKHR